MRAGVYAARPVSGPRNNNDVFEIPVFFCLPRAVLHGPFCLESAIVKKKRPVEDNLIERIKNSKIVLTKECSNGPTQ